MDGPSAWARWLSPSGSLQRGLRKWHLAGLGSGLPRGSLSVVSSGEWGTSLRQHRRKSRPLICRARIHSREISSDLPRRHQIPGLRAQLCNRGHKTAAEGGPGLCASAWTHSGTLHLSREHFANLRRDPARWEGTNTDPRYHPRPLPANPVGAGVFLNSELWNQNRTS